MKRRTLLKLGASVGAVAGAGAAGRYFLLPPGVSETLASQQELASRLVATLSPEARAAVCVDFDDPRRQIHNNGVWGAGARIFGGPFDRAQRSLLNDLFHAGLSPDGRRRVPEQQLLRWPGIHLLSVLVCGDPSTGPWQAVFSGPHVNLRVGGANDGVAFGGPQVYGDQRGNETPGLPGNVYRGQFELANRLFASLDAGRRKEAVVADSPPEVAIKLRGSELAADGVALAATGEETRALANELVELILSPYAESDVAYAHECLAANGGTDGLHIAFYEEGDPRGVGQHQIFRLEGPGAVFYFRGWPHVHAYLSVARDGDRPLSVGRVIDECPRLLEKDDVRRLFERALRAATNSDLTYFPSSSVAGCLRSGVVRTGDVYELDGWNERAAVASVRGENLSAELAEAVRERDGAVESTRSYRIATTEYAIRERTADLTTASTVDTSEAAPSVRDATIAFLDEQGFAGV